MPDPNWQKTQKLGRRKRQSLLMFSAKENEIKMTTKNIFNKHGHVMKVIGLCGMLLITGCAPPASRPSGTSPATSAPAAAAAAPAKLPPSGPECNTILNPDLYRLFLQSPPPPENFYWMFSMNFKGAPYTGCVHVWGRTATGYVPIDHGGIPIKGCQEKGKGKVNPALIQSNHWGKLAVVTFDPHTWIECDINLMKIISQTDPFDDGTGKVKAVLPLEATYTDFAVGAAGTLVAGTASTSDNTALLYEPDPSQYKTCLSQVKNPATCDQIAQQLLRQGNDVFMRAYINGIVGKSGASDTGHAFLNTLNPAKPTQCSFDPTNNPRDETQQRVWWAIVDAQTKGFIHTVYDIKNLTKLVGCDKPDGANPNTVNLWTGDAKIYIGGSPYTESWEGELFEVVIDPQNSGPGADGP